MHIFLSSRKLLQSKAGNHRLSNKSRNPVMIYDYLDKWLTERWRAKKILPFIWNTQKTSWRRGWPFFNILAWRKPPTNTRDLSFHFHTMFNYYMPSQWNLVFIDSQLDDLKTKYKQRGNNCVNHLYISLHQILRNLCNSAEDWIQY